MKLKRFYIFIITLSLLVSQDVTKDDDSQPQQEKKWWSLFKKKDRSSDLGDIVEDENEETVQENLDETPEEEPKEDKKQKKKLKREEREKKKEERKKKKEEKNKDKKGLFNFLKKDKEEGNSYTEIGDEEELEPELKETSSEVEENEPTNTINIDESLEDSNKSVPSNNENELIQAIINQNKKIDLLIEHLDPSGSISGKDSSQENSDSTDILELLQIVQNKFNKIDLAVSDSDSLFIYIEEDMKNLQNKIESINIRLETKIQSIEMSASISESELHQKVDSLEENFSSGGDGIQELKDMNKDLILKMLKIDDKYSSEISRLENKITNLEGGVSNLKEINKDLVVSALTQPNDKSSSKSINNSKKSSSKVSKSIYKKKYDEAYLAYLDANYKRSLLMFGELLDIDNVNDLTDNCQYWVGETYYSMKDYTKAIDAFNKVFDYKDNNKGAYAHYKLGLCYLNLGQTDDAVASFSKVVNDYSDQNDLVQKSKQFINKYSK